MKKLLTLIFYITSLPVLFAQGPNELWDTSFGGSRTEFANAVTATSDGGCIFVGETNSANGDVVGLHGQPASYSDFWVVKLDANGVIQWQKCLGGTYDEIAYDIIQVADGGFVVVGALDSSDGDATFHYGSYSWYDVWVVKLNSSGTLLWQKTYGGYHDDFATSVAETTDGGLIVAAILYPDFNGVVPVTHGGADYWILKLNSLGEMQWNNVYGGGYDERPYSIKGTPDGGCIVVGQTRSYDGDITNGNSVGAQMIPDYWIVKLGPTGVLQWQKAYGGLQGDVATSVSLTNDGGYIVAGGTSSTGGNVTNYLGGGDAWVIKLNASGDLIWQKCIGGSGSDHLYSIIQTIDGGYLACGDTTSSNGDLAGYVAGNKAWIVKLNSSGNVSWQRLYIHYNQNSLDDIMQNPDGTCIAVGSFSKVIPGDSHYEAAVVKLGPNSNSLSNAEFNGADIVLYPNAVNDVLYIQSNGEVFKEINIYDVLGKKINSFFAENNSVDLRSLQSGVYFVEIKNDRNEMVRKKIIKN